MKTVRVVAAVICDSKVTVENQTQNHDPSSPLLFGRVGSDDVIKERKMKSLIQNQMSLFDF